DLDPSNAMLRDEEAAYLKAFNDATLDEEREQVPNVFVAHYNQFLGIIGETVPLDIPGLFSKSLDSNKAHYMFFKEAWEIVGGDVCKAVRDFFNSGKLLKELNHTVIALLPKELMHNYHLDRGPPRCAFKVDIQKAYDTVDWNFLRTVLIGFGFHMTMIRWIMECVTSTSFSLSVNGVLHGYFKGNRDDLFLFARCDLDSEKVIMDALDEFKSISGLVPSISNSKAYFCNVLNHVKLSILNVMPFVEGKLPVKYLGVPLISSRLKYRDCKILVENVKSCVGDRKNKVLSFAGRLQLVQSVLSSMNVYWASVFLLPNQIIEDIERVMRGFLWCQGEMKKGKAKVAWNVVCLPKQEGGQSIKNLQSFNIALDVPPRTGMSWGWRKIMHIRKLVRPYIWAFLGNGRNTSAWFDIWSEHCPLYQQVTPRMIFREGFLLSSVVSDVIIDESWTWPQLWYIRSPILSQVIAP
ncbi:hypothetical protein Tco_1095101, partial [Tanacetum coccineum]